ncbi:GGDEF domain-containing protein [Luteimonas aestuarii]|uniref:GGDEF domain-containing protein n=1 Tax=Luteimonas aestuarii TaxID=453837 RepID=A0A4R5TVB8_9GAMM|nr:GGDEF domain-containing phosphodiesterase [Luteimonas aestuarii]TDK25036.1 GGDEF domain-containing protein [Luteimonas aestuarii]
MLNRDALLACVAETDGDGGCIGVLVLRTQRLRDFEMLFGYAAGEALATALEHRLREALRPVDRLFRIGECDFAMVLPGLKQRQHAALAAGKVSRAARAPLEVCGHPVRANIAVGVATRPHDGTDPVTLCRRADEATLEAVQTAERHAFNSSVERQLVSHDALREAIAANHLAIWLQPIRSVRDGRLHGFESLARWRHRDAWVAPERFIATAEQTGLIGPLTHWSLHGTLRACAPALRENPTLVFSINLSPRAVLEDDVVAAFSAALALWGVPASALKVEVTETAFVSDMPALSEVLRELHATGVAISIDDYGTGYSSMAYLREFPVDEVKLDRSFIQDITVNTRSRQLAAAAVSLAHGIGAQVVAEGVESAQTLALLAEMGCDRYQGYLHGRPAPAAEAIAAMTGGD